MPTFLSMLTWLISGQTAQPSITSIIWVLPHFSAGRKMKFYMGYIRMSYWKRKDIISIPASHMEKENKESIEQKKR